MIFWLTLLKNFVKTKKKKLLKVKKIYKYNLKTHFCTLTIDLKKNYAISLFYLGQIISKTIYFLKKHLFCKFKTLFEKILVYSKVLAHIA